MRARLAMPTIIFCPACGRKLKVPDQFLGGRAKCTGCNNRLEIKLFSDGSYEAAVLPGELVPVRPTPEEWPKQEVPPEPKPEPKRPEKQERVKVPRRPPFLTRTGAVIRCPHCDLLTRIEESDFNAALNCECGDWYAVIVPWDGSIPADCRHCDFKMLVEPKAAGREVSCPDCDMPVQVPLEGIMVQAVKRPRPVEPEPEPEPVAPSLPSGPRQCSICGRYLRNPTPFCYVCRRWFGWR